MKRLLFFLALIASVNAINAHDIHWILFVDTTDESVGETDANTRQVLYSRWINIVNSALAPKGYNAKIHDYTGKRTSPENCKDIVTNLICGPEDIVVFYYIGHGARAIDDKCQYPQMALAQYYEDMCIPLCWVHEELLKKHARFTMTIGMCCNSYAEGLSAKEKVAFSVNQGHSYVQMDAISNIQQLFLKNKGDIIVSSSDKGQASWGGYIPGIGLIDCFSYHFIDVFNTEIGKSYVADWESILTDVQTAVDQETLEASRLPGSKVTRQTPIFDPNIEEVEEPSPVPPVPDPRPDVTKDKDKNVDKQKENMMNSVAEVLDFIISKKLSRGTREQLAQDLMEQYFANNAIVRVLGQDVDVVIDKPSAEDYLGNLAFTTKQNPLKVVVVDCELNPANKITSLIVREVYKK